MRTLMDEYSGVVLSVFIGVMLLIIYVSLRPYVLGQGQGQGDGIMNEALQNTNVTEETNTIKSIISQEASQVITQTVVRDKAYSASELLGIKSGSYVSVLTVLLNDEDVTDSAVTITGDRGEQQYVFHKRGRYALRYTVVDSNGAERTSYAYIDIRR